MRKIFKYCLLVLASIGVFSGCDDSLRYPVGDISDYFPLFDLRKMHKGSDVDLSKDNLFGSTSIAGVVVSDHSGKNMPEGLLVIQERRRLNLLRGISINLGADAAKYVPGDSVHIKVVGGKLQRINGILQITGISDAAVTKVASGRVIPPNRVNSNLVLAKPDDYESTLVAIVKGTFDPIPQATDKLAGDKLLNDGSDNITLHTEVAATFANNNPITGTANYFGIIFNTQSNNTLVPQHRIRTANDIVVLSSTPEPAGLIISGFMADCIGSDDRYEYVQLIATQNINFATTPYAVVLCNNAGGASPAGFPPNGWKSGSTINVAQFRTYQLTISSGSVNKGDIIYVGGDRRFINGGSSTAIPATKWIKAKNNLTTAGDDGNGLKTQYQDQADATKNITAGLMANSGNSFGIAVFDTKTVTKDTKPIDAVFTAAGGSIFTLLPTPMGYRVPNNDFYDAVNPITLQPQPYYLQGTNTLHLGSYPTSDKGYFNKLGGVYNTALNKWVKARSRVLVELTKTSQLEEIETANGGSDITTLK